MSKKDFGVKQCPQCGSMMERVEFTPKKFTGEIRERKNPRGMRKVYSVQKATGPKQVTWYCSENFGHAITETQ